MVVVILITLVQPVRDKEEVLGFSSFGQMNFDIFWEQIM